MTGPRRGIAKSPDKGETEAEKYTPQLKVITCGGFRLVIRQAPTDWLIFYPLPGREPTIVVGQDRDSRVALAMAWMDDNRPGNSSVDAERRGWGGRWSSQAWFVAKSLKI